MVVDLVVPPTCPVCGRPAQAVWCGRCLARLARCGLPRDRVDELAPGVRAVGAYAYLDVVRDTLLAVKLRRLHAGLADMGALMRARLRLPPVSAEVARTWVPTSRRGLAERGVCVPRRLAGPGARPLLRRVRDTPDQTTLDAQARRTAPRGAFAAVGRVPSAVVLIDDVRTTGGTCLAAARALQDAGARRVLVATFAVAGEDAIPA